MRLVTYDRGGVRRLGAWVAGTVVDLPDAVGHPAFPASMESLVARNGGTTLDAARDALSRPEIVDECAVAGARLLAPIVPSALWQAPDPGATPAADARTSTSRHASKAGAGGSRPTANATSNGASSDAPAARRSIIGPDDGVGYPSPPAGLDCGLEVACVVGRAGRNLSPRQAQASVFGYTLMNDWTAVSPNGKGKAATTGPTVATALGPCIVTPDELATAVVRIVARVDGEVWFEGSLNDAAGSFATMISRTSRHEQLRPGDLYGSGTLATGHQHDRRRRLAPGQVVEIEADGIGVLRNRITRSRRRPGSRR
jgi:2-keto-4-pentenoate hydratase/2-oxohepta-3-ene-1,7-dioic acid hydratase in catechol pathway